MFKSLSRFVTKSNKGIMLDIEQRLQPLLLMFATIFYIFSATNFLDDSMNMAISDVTLASLIVLANHALQRRWLPAMYIVLFLLMIVSVAVVSELIFLGSVSSFLYYYGVIPFYVFYIAGRYIGVIYSIVLLSTIWLVFLLSEVGAFALQYTFSEIVFFTPLYAFAAFCAWMFEVEREENRKESYEKGMQHESLLKMIDEVSYRVDMQGVIQRIGSGITKFTDFSPEEVVHHSISIFYAIPEERDAYVAALKADGKVTNYPITIKGKGGQLVNISMNAALVFDKEGKAQYIEGVFRDVTKEVNSENERVAHLNHLQKLNAVEEILSGHDLEASLENVIQELLSVCKAQRAFLTPLCFLNGDKDDLCYQKTFYKHLNSTVDFEPNKFIQHEEVQFYLTSMPKQKKALSKVIQGQSVFSVELMDTYTIDSHAMIVLYTNQDTYWLLGIQNLEEDMCRQQQALFVDISRRIGATLNQLLLQRNLESVAHQAEVASQAKGEFVATISHELRTPLHGVIGLLDLMRQEANQLSIEQQQNLALAQASTQVLRSLIDDVLDLSKIESGNIEIQKQAFNLQQALTDALVPFVMKARDKGLNLNLEMREVAEVIEGDVQRLRQVLLNLVGNAIKFTSQGYVRIVVTQDEEMLFINIEDSGVGIPQDRQAEVFHPFSQVHNLQVLGDNLQEKGTGLGTTISQHFVKMMGGTLTLQSELGVGSTMTICLPLQHVGQQKINVNLHMDDLIQIPSLQAMKNEKEDDVPLAKPWRVLLAEDDPVGRRVAVKQLEREGFVVDVAADGFVAYEMAQQGDYNLLLTDIRMPGLSGLQLTEKIRADENKQGKSAMVIVGLSAYALDDVKQSALDSGMNEFITKPVEIQKLIQVLEMHCES